MKSHVQNEVGSYKGFLWLLLSYMCGAIFITSSKYVLNYMKIVDFLCLWFGAGLIFHIVYGLLTESISFENVKKKYLLILIIYAVLDISGTTSAFIALKMMDPSIISFFNQSQIVFTILLGFLFINEILNKWELVAAGVILFGMLVMTYNSSTVFLGGVALMIYANFVGSINMIIVRKIGCHVGTLTFARIRTLSLFTLFISYNLFTAGKVAVPTVPVLLIILLGSFFGPFLNVISIYKSLEYIPAGKLALFRSIQPFFVMVAAGIFLKILPGFRESVGGFIVVVGCIILAYFHMRHVLKIKRPIRTTRL